MVRSLCEGDTELEKKLRILMLEVEVMRQDGRAAPDTLRADQWQELLKLNTKNQRSQYLLYLFKIEKSKENTKVQFLFDLTIQLPILKIMIFKLHIFFFNNVFQAKKESRRKEFEESPPVITKEYEDDLLYGIQHQSLFLRIRDQSINNMDNAK